MAECAGCKNDVIFFFYRSIGANQKPSTDCSFLEPTSSFFFLIPEQKSHFIGIFKSKEIFFLEISELKVIF